jgi:hypothetical protein
VRDVGDGHSMDRCEAQVHLSQFERVVTELYKIHLDFVNSTIDAHRQNQVVNPDNPVTLRRLSDQIGRVLDLAKAMYEDRKVVNQEAVREALSSEETERLDRLLKFSAFLDKAVLATGASHSINLGTAGSFGLLTDDSGKRANELIRQVFGLNPTAKIQPYEEDRVADRRIGLWKASQDMIEHSETYGNKPRPYYVIAVKNEARRDIVDQITEDRNDLGLRYAPADPNRRPRAIQVEDDSPLYATAPSPDDILIAAEVERERETVIQEFRAILPADQSALLDRWSQGASPTEARRELGLPKSVEGALRSRLKRLQRRLAETG